MSHTITLDLREIKQADSMDFEDAVLHAAVCYVKSGVMVLPLEPNSKKLPSGGGINYMSASMKESTIRKWFGEGGKYRGHNLGIACGMTGGVMAFDIDAKPVGGTTGLKEIARIVEQEGSLPAGPKQITPSAAFIICMSGKKMRCPAAAR